MIKIISKGEVRIRFTCDKRNGFFFNKTFTATGNSIGDCRRQARAIGWVLHDNGKCTCPELSGATRMKRENQIAD